MAKKFSLIDIIEESSKVSKSNLNNLFENLETQEQQTKKTIGIRNHLLDEMDFDFSSGPDAGEDEDEFRNAASHGEFNDEDDDDEFGDEEDSMDATIGGDNSPNISDADAREKYPDKYADMVSSYDEQDMDEPDDFDPNASSKPKFNTDDFMRRHFGESDNKLTLLQMLSKQVNDMGGNVKTPKKVLPKRDDYFVNEKFQGSNNFIMGKISKIHNKRAKVQIGENESIVKFSSMIPAIKSDNEELKQKAKEFKIKHPNRNIWMVSI
jgi:hypothetical protein